MDNSEKLPTVLSLCTGYGGIERGLELAGVKLRTLAYVEIEAYAIANLVAKAESGQLDSAPIWTNLKTLPVECFRDRVSLITGGYPCPPFSVAGHGSRKGENDPRNLWPYIREIIRAVRPVRVFFENVEGHISLGLSSVLSDLEEDGYRATWGIFSATEVGAPHQRKRVYIMADSDNGQREFQNKEIRAGRDTIIDGSAQMADTISARSQGWISGWTDTQRQGFFRRTGRSSAALQWRQEQSWSPEPNVGRVVDGCPDRVDRIRLLGNGVVPQTAAKAWQVLNEEIGRIEQ